MSKLKLSNTLTRKKEEFVPIDKDHIKMYVCGPTVYDYPHVGNARPLIVFDVLFRLLKTFFNKSKVTYVRNITDIDDKIIEASNKKNISINELTQKVTKDFHDDCNYLGCLQPTNEPKATEHIKEMIDLVEKLLKNNFAYISNDHVYFNVSSFDSYGQLSNKKVDDLISGARVEVSDYKRNPADFVLWKPSNDGEPSWDSPFGKGRPGWHLECSAMSEKYLGSHFDIHGGGLDLIFPHHENEIAQSCCANKTKYFSNFWLHNGYVTVTKQKMSKSLGNFITINELKEKYNGQVVRLAMLSTHYTQPFDWNNEILSSSKKILDKWYDFYNDNNNLSLSDLSFLLDDLNTPQMITNLHELYSKAKNGDKDASNKLSSSCKILGLFNEDKKSYEKSKKLGKLDESEIEKLILKRNQARDQKDFKTSDEIRDYLDQNGVLIKDTKGKTTWEYK
jgi:cysteinyl-tRNA synthetase